MSRFRIRLVPSVLLVLALVAPSFAPAEIVGASREIEVDAGMNHDSSYWSTFDYDDDRDRYRGLGVWDRTLEARVSAIEQAPDGVGRVELTSNVTGNRVAFETRVTSQHGDYSTEGGDPNDVGSYYYTYESTYGSGHAQLTATIEIATATPYTLDFSSVDQRFVRSHSGSVRLVGDLPMPGLQTIFDLSLPRDTQPIRREGVLQPGTYSLYVNHPSQANEFVGMEVLFVIPEPSAGLLVGLGLMGLGSARRRRG